MRILIDEELRVLVENDSTPLVTPKPKQQNWFDRDSPIQPSSLDFHVGKMFVPGNPPGADGAPLSIGERFILNAGQTIVIRTEEEICLPSALAGFGFPPSRLSSQGILMTNPGHLDPGYKGHLHLTAINMGRASFEIRKGDPIVTLVLFQLNERPKADFVDRYGAVSPSAVTQAHINNLSPDFANVQERAESIANRAVEKADISIKRAQNRGALIGVIVTALLTLFTLYYNSSSKADALDENNKAMEKRFDERLATSKEVNELRNKIQELQSQIEASQKPQKEK
jgi:dCTP deaminase